jgi:NADP-dependent 3-hydroxy acid dehydrogenase YdfG
MQDKIVVVTGASSGIGALLAEQVAARGGKPILVARRAAELEAAAARCGPDAMAIVADVTRRADHARVVEAAIARYGHIDAYVNNAGRGISRLPTELTDDDLDSMFLINTKSVMYGIQAVLPHFKDRRAGHLVTVSSMLGRIPFAPIRSAYSAAKHATNALVAMVRAELRASGYDAIHVSTVHPGVVATDFGNNAAHGGPDSRALPNAQPADEVAAIIADVIDRPRADVYTRPGAREAVISYYSAE